MWMEAGHSSAGFISRLGSMAGLRLSSSPIQVALGWSSFGSQNKGLSAMSSKSRRIKPKSTARRRDQFHQRASTGEMSQQAGSRQSGPFRMSHLRRLRAMIDELIIKVDAKECLTEHGRNRFASRIETDTAIQEMLESLNDYVQAHLAGPQPTSTPSIDSGQVRVKSAPGNCETVRVQMKMSVALLKTLRAMRTDQRNASHLVENILWDCQTIQDAARLKGISLPGQSESPAA